MSGKWIALALLVVGVVLAGSAKPAAAYGEEGLPLYALIGWLALLVGGGWLAVMVFMSL
jgi:hypothetical protein